MTAFFPALCFFVFHKFFPGNHDNYDTVDDEEWLDVTPTPPQETSNNLVNWIVMFCVIFLPAIIFGASIYENNQQPDAMHIPPIYGVIAGLVMSIGLGVYTSLVPLWILILMIVAIVILVAGMIKG